MADQVQRTFGLLGERQEHLHVGVDAERLVDGPRAGLAIADEVRRENAPVLLERLDQRQPLLVGSARAMAEHDARPFALVEISDLDAADGQLLHNPPTRHART